MVAPDSLRDLRRGITGLTDDEDYLVGDEEGSGSGNEQGDESKELLDVIKGE